ncbi:hypothetical protein BN1088_1030005 [Sphingobacterium sp. PM2-P1-29]|nr:hypothetical protein BN1088_1030005 [Sphingobacterium sp. PM2-P1-29]
MIIIYDHPTINVFLDAYRDPCYASCVLFYNAYYDLSYSVHVDA